MSAKQIIICCAVLLLVFAAFLTFSTVLYLRSPGDSDNFFLLLGRIPGEFIFKSFHYAGFFIPFYIGAAAVLLLMKEFPKKPFFLLNLSILPFFTFGILLRLLSEGADSSSLLPRVLIKNLTERGAVVIFFLLFVLELLFILRWALLGGSPGRKSDDGSGGNERKALMIEDRSIFEAAVSAAEADSAPAASPVPEAGSVPAPEQGKIHLSPIDTIEDVGGLQEMEADSDQPGDIFGEEEAAEFAGFKETEEEIAQEEESDDEELTVYFGGGVIEDAEAPGFDEEADEDPDYQETAAGGNGRSSPAPKSRSKRRRSYKVPIRGLLDEYKNHGYWEIDEETKHAADVLRTTLEEFKIQAEVTGIKKGPVITMFEILPAPGVKLSKITNLADNIALRLAASRVRIVAPIPGKHAVGIEIPNKRRNIVSFAEMITHEDFLDPDIQIPIALGKDISGDAQVIALDKTPHILIAGATGSGKSVCVNSIICSILYRKTPEEVKLILIDPKIVELKFYNDIPHLLTPVITEPKKAFQALQYCVYEMERRYSLLDALGVRDIASYNKKIKKRNLATEPIPYIVIIVDEFADLMQTSGKELETTLARLAAMSRAVGIHLVLATQRPSIDVITGLIKANIPSRIAFMVASKFDSRIIIDTVGAEKLLGGGDMLFTSAWNPFPVRMQGAFLSEEEVERIVEHVKTLGEPDYIDDEIFFEDDEESFFEDDDEDPLMEKAIEIITAANKASASYLQRRLKIGYNRAARLVEALERQGIVGPQNGSKPREVLTTAPG